MEVDRTSQNRVLNILKKYYPSKIPTTTLCKDLFTTAQLNSNYFCTQLKANLSYLEEHGLIEQSSHLYKITAKGIDFIADDGGVSAILNTKRVILDEASLLPLVQALSPTDKDKLRDQILALPFEILKESLLSVLGLST